MKPLIPSLVATHKELFVNGAEQLNKRRTAWDSTATNIISYFEALKSEWQDLGGFFNVCILDSKTVPEIEGIPPFVSIYFGKNPIGYTTFDNPKKLAFEGGCTLTISQDVFGHLACIIYPFKSELAKMPEKYLAVSVYYNPWEVTDLELDKLARVFLSYAQISSVYGHPRFIDRARIFTAKLCDWWLKFKIKKIVGDMLKEVVSATLGMLTKSQ